MQDHYWDLNECRWVHWTAAAASGQADAVPRQRVETDDAAETVPAQPA